MMTAMGAAARAAAQVLAGTPGTTRDQALRQAAAAVRRQASDILAANHKDMAAARDSGLSAALLDRLELNPARVEAIAVALEGIAEQADPVGRELARWTRPNGLDIARVSVPLGVIAVIYESRPNVTADAGGLCLKSGNAVILRGGSESRLSSAAIHACLAEGLRQVGLPEAAIQLVATADRAAVGALLAMAGVIDVVIPRGGRGLIERIVAESRVPVIKHLDGNCHVYVDGAADLAKARAIVVNSKMRRTGICGAAETLLVDRRGVDTHLTPILDDLIAAGCAIRGDETVQRMDSRVTPASETDWQTEYLDAILAVRVVDGVAGAIAHINRWSSHHTESIVTEDPAAAEAFVTGIDSGILLVNASTQFADGGEFGMGAEIGISTDKLHARGPVGAEQLTSYKYVVRGSGQVRP
ncbi:MAG: glutamate-5-semialdehyde dehydrogenase [Alphaproteobacteria bacterium]